MQPLPNIPTYHLTADNFIFTVIIEDAQLHTDASPWCSDMTCPCHQDEDLRREYMFKPIEHGLLTEAEAQRLYAGHQLTAPTQDDEPTSDEEIEQIMSEPSPLEVEVEENYYRPLRISTQFQQQMDSLLLEHD